MKTKSLIGMTAMLIVMVTSAQAATVVEDDFNAAALDPMWTLDDDAASYGAGGGFAHGAGHLRFNNIKEDGYGHIETTVNTSGGARVDAIMRHDAFGTITWGMGSGFYFDADNWVSVKLFGVAGGGMTNAFGWVVDVMDGGVLGRTELNGSGNTSHRFDWYIGGVELTGTDIKVYTSPIPAAAPGANFGGGAAQVDSIATLATTLSRPASFTGDALAIIGKGFTGAGFPNPDFDNLGAGASNPGFAGIDYVRITIVPEPVSFGLMALGGLVMLGRYRRRCV